ncbi:MAG: hypothetical protein KDC47_06645 [Flavobacteriaceae bacterium]|nr:hypothetical protein [Flavobacteriaceae bacterium]
MMQTKDESNDVEICERFRRRPQRAAVNDSRAWLPVAARRKAEDDAQILRQCLKAARLQPALRLLVDNLPRRQMICSSENLDRFMACLLIRALIDDRLTSKRGHFRGARLWLRGFREASFRPDSQCQPSGGIVVGADLEDDVIAC